MVWRKHAALLGLAGVVMALMPGCNFDITSGDLEDTPIDGKTRLPDLAATTIRYDQSIKVGLGEKPVQTVEGRAWVRFRQSFNDVTDDYKTAYTLGFSSPSDLVPDRKMLVKYPDTISDFVELSFPEEGRAFKYWPVDFSDREAFSDNTDMGNWWWPVPRNGSNDYVGPYEVEAVSMKEDVIQVDGALVGTYRLLYKGMTQASDSLDCSGDHDLKSATLPEQGGCFFHQTWVSPHLGPIRSITRLAYQYPQDDTGFPSDRVWLRSEYKAASVSR